jgi:hypothetical protein
VFERQPDREQLRHRRRQVERRPVQAARVQVRRNRVRLDAGGQLGFDDVERETAGAVADVEQHAGPVRRDDGRRDPVRAQQAGLTAGAVRDDVARPQQPEHRVDRRGCGADVQHDGYAARLRHRDGAAQRLKAVRPDGVRVHPDLDAGDQVAVGGERFGGQVDVAVGQVVVLAVGGGEADR